MLLSLLSVNRSRTVFPAYAERSPVRFAQPAAAATLSPFAVLMPWLAIVGPSHSQRVLGFGGPVASSTLTRAKSNRAVSSWNHCRQLAVILPLRPAREIGGDSNRFKMFGTVPTALGVELRVQRKVNKGAFQDWTTELTAADTGRFSVRIYGGKRGSTICYRVVVPAGDGYRTTKGKKWCIETEEE